MAHQNVRLSTILVLFNENMTFAQRLHNGQLYRFKLSRSAKGGEREVLKFEVVLPRRSFTS